MCPPLYRYRVITEAEHMLLRNPQDRVDTPYVVAGGEGQEAVNAVACDTKKNPDLCMQVGAVG